MKPTVKKIGDIVFYLVLAVFIFILVCQLGLLPLRFVYIKSGSMSPTINMGDLVAVKTQSNLIPKVGDVILFKDNSSDVVHRVIKIENSLLTTKGDANNAPDSRKTSKIKGIVLFNIPYLGYLVAFVQSNIFWILAVVLLIILIDILYENKLFPFHKLNKEDT